jgi:hypothetical protein
VAVSNELTLRERSAGGSVRDAVRELTPPFAQGRRRVVLLVHGYNDTEDAARRSYDAFTDDVDALGPGARALLADIGKLYWPGDAGLGPLSLLSYPSEIAPATECAEKLAAYLRTLAGPGGTPTEFYFVCHSLGNRVILELLDRLAATPAPLGQVTAVVLMAAAVPVDMVEDDGPLFPGATLPGKTLALYSRDDNVLRWAFPLGETAAGEGLFPTAVGRFGEPPGVWTERQELTGDDHSDYWGDPRSAARVARLLGVVVAREIEAVAPAERALPAAVSPAVREIGVRGLPTRRAPEA